MAALKLLELMSFKDIDEFNLHKWAFLFENYAVEITEDNSEQDYSDKSPFMINPFLMDNVPDNMIVKFALENLK